MASNLGLSDVGSWYKNALGRTGDAGGIDYWQSQLSGGADPAAVRNSFYASAAKEAQGDNYSGAMDSYDENRIATAMGLADQQGMSYQDYNKAANPTSWNQTAGERLAGLPGGTTPAASTAPPVASPASTTPTPKGYEKNPYLDEMAAGITSQMNDNWNRNLAPSIRSGAMATGGFGGSRQGVVEANALNDMNRSLGQNLSNLYGQDYDQSQNRNLQKYGMDQSYSLGQGQLALGNRQADNSYNLGLGQNANQLLGINNQMALGQLQNDTQRYGVDTNASASRYGADRGVEASKYGADASAGASMANSNNSLQLGLRQSDLGFAQLDANIYNSNFNNQLASANFGLSAYNQLQNGNNLGLQAGTQIQNTPLNYQTQFSNAANAAGGLGTQTSSTVPGNALTGAMGGYQLYNAYNQSHPPAVTDGGYSIGQGSAYGGSRAGL